MSWAPPPRIGRHYKFIFLFHVWAFQLNWFRRGRVSNILKGDQQWDSTTVPQIFLEQPSIHRGLLINLCNFEPIQNFLPHFVSQQLLTRIPWFMETCFFWLYTSPICSPWCTYGNLFQYTNIMPKMIQWQYWEKQNMNENFR